MRVELAETPAEFQVLLARDVLVAEQQDAMFQERPVDLAKIRLADRRRDIDVAHLRAERVGKTPQFDGHRLVFLRAIAARSSLPRTTPSICELRLTLLTFPFTTILFPPSGSRVIGIGIGTGRGDGTQDLRQLSPQAGRWLGCQGDRLEAPDRVRSRTNLPGRRRHPSGRRVGGDTVRDRAGSRARRRAGGRLAQDPGRLRGATDQAG